MCNKNVFIHRLAEAYGAFSADRASSDDIAYVPRDVSETIRWLEEVDTKAAEVARFSYIDRIKLVNRKTIEPDHIKTLTQRLNSAN